MTAISHISNLEDGWAGEGTYAPTKNIYNRLDFLLSMLSISEKYDVEIEATLYGTISIDFIFNEFLLSAEIGETGANYYTKELDGSYTTYKNDDKNTGSIEEMVININKTLTA